jgi:lipopolysaccharide export system permease LptF/LptG-like protein
MDTRADDCLFPHRLSHRHAAADGKADDQLLLTVWSEAHAVPFATGIPLTIPIALPLAIVCGAYHTRISAHRITGVLLLAMVATLVAFAAMLLVPLANEAFRVALAEELDSRGLTYSLSRGMSELSLSELATRSEEYDAGGFLQNAQRFRRTCHMRFALPAATFVLSLLALGICGTLRGRAPRVVAMIIVFGLYWATFALAAWNTMLPPIVSVWSPNIVFTALSLALLKLRSKQAASDSDQP